MKKIEKQHKKIIPLLKKAGNVTFEEALEIVKYVEKRLSKTPNTNNSNYVDNVRIF